jgi:hypothetical protein
MEAQISIETLEIHSMLTQLIPWEDPTGDLCYCAFLCQLKGSHLRQLILYKAELLDVLCQTYEIQKHSLWDNEMKVEGCLQKRASLVDGEPA